MENKTLELLRYWARLWGWQRSLVLLYAHGLYTRRGLLPAFGFQMGAVLFATWTFPDEPLLWSFVFILSMVYALLLQAILRR